MTVINVYIFQCLNSIKDKEDELIYNKDVYSHDTRSKSNIHIDSHRLSKTNVSFPVSGIKFFNSLPLSLRLMNKSRFNGIIKNWLLQNHFYRIEEFLEADKTNLAL